LPHSHPDRVRSRAAHAVREFHHSRLLPGYVNGGNYAV
jgi:hypothetical protein